MIRACDIRPALSTLFVLVAPGRGSRGNGLFDKEIKIIAIDRGGPALRVSRDPFYYRCIMCPTDRELRMGTAAIELGDIC